MKRERERSLWHSLFTGGYVSTYVGAVIKNPNHFFFVFASGVEVMCSRTEGPAWLNSPPSSSSCVMSIYIRRYTRMLPSSGLPIRFQGGSQDTYVLEKERWWSPHLLLFLPPVINALDVYCSRNETMQDNSQSRTTTKKWERSFFCFVQEVLGNIDLAQGTKARREKASVRSLSYRNSYWKKISSIIQRSAGRISSSSSRDL